jgi:nicotinamidase-related amidase
LWDQHWCPPATRRVAQLAPRVNALVAQARWAGVLIVQAPSETLDFYADSPARRRALAAPPADLPPARERQDPPLPIDDRDGGCEEDARQYGAWTRQHPAVEIHPVDAMSDDGAEVHRLFAQGGIKRVMVTGVHTNMCVLGRSFGIRQLVRWGYECVLVRDLTDAMYDPADPPYVPHDEGTALVVGHIERHWCPSALADDIVAGLPQE